jgi:hypothetical protein
MISNAKAQRREDAEGLFKSAVRLPYSEWRVSRQTIFFSCASASLRLCVGFLAASPQLCAVLLAGFYIARSLAGPLLHDVYVWQRDWNQPLRDALAQHGTNFHSVVALAAEVTWKNRQPQPVRVVLDYESLRKTGRPVGLALRIGPFAGPFRSNDAIALTFAALARSLLAEAASNHIAIAELQFDFDCAESKLDGYRVWVETIRQRIAPTPLVITALPSWLKQPSFANLARACDGYVLQVHSLERPKSFDAPFTLCDPAAARKAVELAAPIGAPFRVALPTYGYVVAFDANDKLIGLAADGPSIKWPPGTRIREVRSDSAAIAQLVAQWNTNHPAAMQGFIWYRLPIESENLNWRFSTLGVVMSGRVPQADLKVGSRSPEPELLEVILRNEGSADFQNKISVRVRVPGARVIASDALGGFDLGKTGSAGFLFRAEELVLRAGEQRKIGWLRTNRKAEVELEIAK